MPKLSAVWKQLDGMGSDIEPTTSGVVEDSREDRKNRWEKGSMNFKWKKAAKHLTMLTGVSER